MPIITKGDLNRIVGQSYKSKEFTKSAVTDSTKTYDIFLSHSYLDRETVLQIKSLLEDLLHLDVYVDWIENPGLDRSQVTPATAAELRRAMDRSRCLLYAISTNSARSSWMPWELGYSDAKHSRVAVLPISDYTATISAYRNQEFVGLYPYIDLDGMQGQDPDHQYLWVLDSYDRTRYSQFPYWLKTGQLIKHSG